MIRYVLTVSSPYTRMHILSRVNLLDYNLARSEVSAILDDVVVIETVGVGQGEVDIAKTADVSIVVTVPGAGDDVQTLKAGIMEIGDIFVTK